MTEGDVRDQICPARLATSYLDDDPLTSWSSGSGGLMNHLSAIRSTRESGIVADMEQGN